ncbi:MAG TPA: hypothetical protein VOA64_00300 [Candidatus Dormibacteraeota bacterium]|nr:hypothetical protein [Candidatus Dormibacteraeota bacterium]
MRTSRAPWWMYVTAVGYVLTFYLMRAGGMGARKRGVDICVAYPGRSGVSLPFGLQATRGG